MSYAPPAGIFGHAIASFFRSDPKTAMDEDLVRMKSLLEQGKASAHGKEVTIDELRRALGPSNGAGKGITLQSE
jgi:hypothetical protein